MDTAKKNDVFRTPSLLFPAAAYALCFLGLWPFYAHIIGPDSISYISIARHYLAGHWGEAVNTNWNPMYSWLLVSLLAVQVPGLAALKVLCFFSGLLTLYAVRLLCRQFEIGGRLLFVVMFVAAGMICEFALLKTGPDLLLASFLLLYFKLILDPNYPLASRSGVFCGVLGAIAYLTKGYAFYFFLLHFPLMSFLHWLVGDPALRRKVLRQFAYGLAAFALCCAPWLLLMSARIGRPSAGTTGDWNYRLVGPKSPGYPQYFRLVPPAREHGISMWEEPSASLLPPWSPLQSSIMFRHQLKLLSLNSKILAKVLMEFSIFSITILLASAVLGLSGTCSRLKWLLPFVTILAFPAGYLLVYVEGRYLWSIALLLLILGAAVLDRILSARVLSKAGTVLLLASFGVSFLVIPARALVGQRNSGAELWELSQTIRQRFPIRGKLAGCGRWDDSLALAYYLDLQFYGNTGCSLADLEFVHLLNPELTPTQLQAETVLDNEGSARDLRRYGIDYYFAWSTCGAIPSYVASREEITSGALHDVRIFRLK